MRINCIVTHQTLAISAPEAAEKSVNYLECAFYFLTPDWQGLAKTAFFTGTDGKNYSAVIQDGTCVVPWEAIAEPGFLRMSVAGFGQMSLIITTDIASLRMRETIFGGDPSKEPSPDQYTQIMQVMSGKVDTDQGVQNSGKVLGINDSGKVEPMDNAGGGSSDLLWRPSVSESGDLSWTQDSSTDPPQAVNIMGPQGPAGKDGDPGQKGKTGATGPAGKDGITPTIGENGNWYLGETDTGKPSRGEKGDVGDGVPSGGTTGQVLTKNSNSDGDASWKNPSGVSDEQVKTAVRDYFEENPVSGMTSDQIMALDGMLKLCAFTENPSNQYTMFCKAFGIGIQEPEPSREIYLSEYCVFETGDALGIHSSDKRIGVKVSYDFEIGDTIKLISPIGDNYMLAVGNDTYSGPWIGGGYLDVSNRYTFSGSDISGGYGKVLLIKRTDEAVIQQDDIDNIKICLVVIKHG